MKKHNMKPTVNLFDKAINDLNKLSNVPKEHQMKCSNCGQIMDLRDLSQVFAHEDCNDIPIDYKTMKQIPYSGSQKIGDPVFWTKDKKPINLN